MAENFPKLFDEAELGKDWQGYLAVFQEATEIEKKYPLPDWLAVEMLWMAVRLGYGTPNHADTHEAFDKLKGMDCWESVLAFNKAFPLLDNDYLIFQGIDTGIADLSQFLAHPQSKWLSPHRLFDILYYQQTESPNQIHHPLVHFFRHSNGGQLPSVNPNPLFNIDWYRQTYLADQPHRHPLLHYVEHFNKGFVQPSICFDTDFVKKSQKLPDETEPLSYYLKKLSEEWTEFCSHGFSPCPFFDRKFYLERYPDIKSAAENGKLDPFYHFYSSGIAEGRYGHLWLRHDMFVPELMPTFNAKKKVAVILLGMHRSGTSALTRVINLLGMDLPSDLMEANFANQAGYWESDELATKYHDPILASFNSAWDDVLPIAEELQESEDWHRFREVLAHYLVKEFHSSSGFVLKDPRMCKLVPLWLEVLADLDVELKIIIPFRDPLEVAKSLEQRDGFTLEKSSLLWLGHVLSAERETRKLTRCFVNYKQLLENPRQVIEQLTGQCGLNWPNCSEDVFKEIDEFIDPNLHHQRSTLDASEPVDLPAWVVQTHQALERLTQNAYDEESLHVLDQIRQSVGQASRLFATVLAEKDSGHQHELERYRQKHDLIVQHAIQIQKLAG